MAVTISRAVHEQILAHAAESPHHEVCGLLFGAGDRIDAAEPTANIAENATKRFEVNPTHLFAAIRAERSGGRKLIGHYHSHPRGDAVPSHEDREQAQDVGRLWLIVGGGELAAWRAVEPGRLEAVELSLASAKCHRQ